MILFILLLVPTSNLPFNHNILNNILYAKGKANTIRDDRAENDVITNNNKVTQHQKQVTNKVVILTFGDIHKSQFTTAKRILDQYGFKGSFFVPCDMVGEGSRMNWNDIKTLYNEGHNIQAKSDDNLIDLSRDRLDSEVSQPKAYMELILQQPLQLLQFGTEMQYQILR